MTDLSDPQVMAWDTEFFGIRTGRATHLDGVTEWAVENAVGLMCLLVDTIAEVQEAEEIGWKLTDVRVTLERDAQPIDSVLRGVRPSDHPALVEIAATAYRGLTRFYNDPLLAARAEDLYRAWMRAELAGAADAVIVSTVAGEPSGYVTLKDVEDHSEISLIGVRSDLRGRGLGRELVESAVEWAWHSGKVPPRISVVTQGANVAALRTFESCGFRMRRTQFWLHKRYL